MASSDIVIRGAREHNLRNVTLSLPRNKLIVMTGVSGSGKSSLAFDTLYAEGQRRYVESLSTYARQFLGQMPKPDVDSISGLAPSISIQQKSTSRNPRSTVGTITEIFDYLRVLYARVGQGYCYVSGQPIRAQAVDQIVESILTLEAGTRFQILAPIVQQQKGEFRDLFTDLLKRGFLRARVDGTIVSLTEELNLRKHHKHSIEVVIDRLTAGPGARSRVSEAAEQALKLADGKLICAVEQRAESGSETTRDRLYSANYSCPESGMSYEPPSPQLFSFNSPIGMCPDCNGLGMRHGFPMHQLIVEPDKSIQKGAILLLPSLSKIGRWPRHILTGAAEAIEQDTGMEPGSLLKMKWSQIPEKAQQLWLYGTGNRHVTFTWKTRGGAWKHGGTWEGWVNRLLESYRTAKNPMRRRQLEKYMEVVACSSCNGERLNRQARNVRITTSSKNFLKRGHSAELSLPEVCKLSIAETAEFFESLKLDPTSQLIAEEAIKEIRGRLGFLMQCGLHYLSLDRSAPTLSGGESQRIRLAGQIGCGLVGVVYILDEPSIGLHPRDNTMLLSSLQHLRDQGNTVIVVEHDEETMRAADHVVDFGPGPGIRGGEVVVEGSVDDLLKSERSVTGQYLSGRKVIEIPRVRRAPERGEVIIHNATHNNLRNVTARFPLGRFICVTGVSGSGKSSLVNDILWQVVNRDLNKGNGDPGRHEKLTGLDLLDKAIDIDQSPIGRTPRSNPATYVKVFDEIRSLFTNLPQSKLRGYKAGRFSFNVEGGRCEACEGHGATKLEMDFLADLWVPCNVCEGRRFSHETLEVRFKDHSIADVLNLEIRDALKLFESFPKITLLLKTLCDVGLDYMRLGQASPTLSGGEAQRIKLARELGKRSTGKTLYLLDEPTTGLHFADVHKLLEVLHGFVEDGNTVIVIEHNLDVIKTADWVLDIGPEGGSGGGTIVAEGTPEDIARCSQSHTGIALRTVLPGFRPVKSGAKTKASRKKADPFVRSERIQIVGASQHNLQGVNVEIPRDQMSVFCGPSGSGKSSLAMDTLYAEGQRRYVESLSAYARQFLGQMPKPRVESIQGLSPAIAIEQKTVGATPRSTVGTVTEIYDYLRVLYARLGEIYCPDCGIPARKQTTDEIVQSLLALGDGTRVLLLAPVTVDRTIPYSRLWERLRNSGFVRVRVDGETHALESPPEIDHRRHHEVDVVVDRLTIEKKSRGRITDSVESALALGKGIVRIAVSDANTPETEWKMQRFSLHLSCGKCQASFEPLAPQRFSFNSPLGWCPACEGLGTEFGANQSLLITSGERSLLDGAVGAWPDLHTNPAFKILMQAVAERHQIPLEQPWYRLSAAQQRIILYGGDDELLAIPEKILEETAGHKDPSVNESLRNGLKNLRFRYRGLFPTIEAVSRMSFVYRRSLSEMGGQKDCSLCNGTRLQPEPAATRLRDVTLPQFCRMPLVDALKFLRDLKLSATERKIAGDLLNEAVHRLNFLVDVGLDYLTLDRGMPTLSGGESQRIRLAGQIGRSLTGVLYVLDEPTIGLHPRDNGRLLKALHRLRDLGNTVLLVEHDREVLEAADRLYDFGPGAGRLGGSIVAQGSPAELCEQFENSLTGGYLSGRMGIPVPIERRISPAPEPDSKQESVPDTTKRRSRKKAAAGDETSVVTTALSPASKSTNRSRASTADVVAENIGAQNIGVDDAGGTSVALTRVNRLAQLPESPSGWLSLLGASLNNLRSADLHVPLGALTCITGVSGSGKSSLLMDTLARAVARRLNMTTDPPGPFQELKGIEHLSKIVIVDQNPIGNTPASNPATYTGVFDEIRELFCRMPEAKVRGYKPGRFSFNRPGGRCEDCEGMGQKKIEMHFLPDVWVECPTCRGKRFNAETLTVQFNSCSIADVLEMPISRALEVFQNVPKIRAPLATLAAIGLDYLTLGQSAPTLSGGEAQRIKLAAELSRPNRGRTLYLLDEPTTGLHFDDIARLLSVLNSLVAQGNTVVVIEHNLDVIKTADWVVDVGPEAGSGGGRIVVQGTPEDVVRYSAKPLPGLRSWTGEMLAPVLKDSHRAAIETFDVSSVAEKKSTDVSIEQLGKSAKLPWETDGRRWHTVDRISHSGSPCNWEGEALSLVIDLLSKEKGLGEPNWNHRSTVELKAPGGLGWFLHARTGGDWLLSLCFRVTKNTFDSDVLDESLGLKTLDDIEEIPVYGREPRVKVRNLKSAWQEVTIKVWKKEEIDTREFRSFLKQALAAYLKQSKHEAGNPEDLMPWKKLGRKWHLMRNGLPGSGRVSWEFDLIGSLLQLLESQFEAATCDYELRGKIQWTDAKSSQVLAELHTKRSDGAILILWCPHDAVTIGAIASLGESQSIEQTRDGRDTITISFTTTAQTKAAGLVKLIQTASK
ncbi:MAG: excinuclease ABC subunit UvrA [Planctomyces sp.]|nr:excinuclease ABC subunit UvrA [Planctomyces sp.]